MSDIHWADVDWRKISSIIEGRTTNGIDRYNIMKAKARYDFPGRDHLA